MSLDRLLEELTLERYGPVVRDAERVPHLPLWLYRENWRQEEQECDDSEAIAAFERRRDKQTDRECKRRAARKAERQLRVLSEEEAEGAA